MWIRKEIKKEARGNLKKNYWRILGVSLIIAFVFGGFKIEPIIADTPDMVGYVTADKLATATNAEIISDWAAGVRHMSGDDNGNFLEFAGEKYTPTKGVFAHIYNNATKEQSFLFGFLNSINNFAFKDRIGPGVIIFIGSVIMLFFTFGVVNVLIVGQCRFILESRIYHGSKIGRILFPWRVKRWRKTTVVMAKRTVFQTLWDLTIIGGAIKHYSYLMIPYIVAENPEVSSKEAFAMSMDMMRGNKFKAFKMDISLLGWHLLSFLTLGAVKWMFLNPYVDTIYAELYMNLRNEALEKNVSYGEYFNDKLLCTETSLSEYPVDMYPLYSEHTKRWIKIEYNRSYSIDSIILMFFAFSMIGWLWEVSLHLFSHGIFVNRGTMHGPWLPIYGAGGVLIVLLLKRFADKPLLLFALAVVLCGVVEYTTAWYLWEHFHKKWWDYSGYFLNLHGRICAEGLFVFGLGGCGFVYILAPLFDELFKKIPKKVRWFVCVLLIALFVTDHIYSSDHPNEGKGVTDYSGDVSSKIMILDE